MKKISYIIASAVAVFGLASCGIDDVKNVNEMSTENFPVSAADGEAALASHSFIMHVLLVMISMVVVVPTTS